MDNNFNVAFNLGNAAFARDCAEPFHVEVTTGKQKGIPGCYSANSIDDMTAMQNGTLGGQQAQNAVHIFVSKAVMAAARIVDGTVMSARGKKVRLKEVSDAGDNKVMLICEKFGVTAQ